MSPAEVARLRALCERATPGPWSVDTDDGMTVVTSDPGTRTTEYVASVVWPMDEDGDPYAADAELIAAARTAIPALLDALVAARREGAEAVRDAAMSVADDLAGGTPEASDAEWAHELMHRVAAAVARVSARPVTP